MASAAILEIILTIYRVSRFEYPCLKGANECFYFFP